MMTLRQTFKMMALSTLKGWCDGKISKVQAEAKDASERAAMKVNILGTWGAMASSVMEEDAKEADKKMTEDARPPYPH